MRHLFDLKARGTTVKTEVIAGATTFMTMAYILVVNPLILSEAGMNQGAVFTATALAACVATALMGLLANLPFALAPGMGLNSFFAFTVVKTMGFSWQVALTAVLLEGIIFIFLSAFGIRAVIINSIPGSLKKAISAGIGIFIAFIGMGNAGWIVAHSATKVSLGEMSAPGAILAGIGLVLMVTMLFFHIKGAILIGILATTLLGIPMGISHLPSEISWLPPSLAPTFLQFDWLGAGTHIKGFMDLLIVVFTFLFVDLFDTAGTLIGVATRAGFIGKDGKIPRAKQALLADAVGTTVGSCLGTSTITTYVESASGVNEGGRTGLTSLTISGFFLLSLFLSPFFLIVPTQAVAPALIVVGLFFLSSIKDIPTKGYPEAIPAFLTMIGIPLTFNIADGLSLGVISYAILGVTSGKIKSMPVSTLILAAILLLRLAL